LAKTPKDKNQDADKRRDELAKRVLKMPPQPKTAKTSAKPKRASSTSQR